MKRIREKRLQRLRRARRTRARLRGTSQTPRLSVFRSNRHLFVQLIDDTRGVSLASASDIELARPKRRSKPMSPRERAAEVGAKIAVAARAVGVTAVRFDRGAYQYHGLVAAVAEGARKGGLKV